MSDSDPVRTLARELILAAGMISLLVLAMWAHTGSMPPLVVVESNSMQHDSDGEIGTIDAGDLVLVHSPDDNRIITFVEATNPDSVHYGYESLGMEGDVIIFERNGETDSTPIIHRALFEIVVSDTVPTNDESECEEGVFWEGVCATKWSVTGTDQVNVEKINLIFDGENVGKYECGEIAGHNESKWYIVEDYTPISPGYITLGDNNNCDDDQKVGKYTQSGLMSFHSGIVRPVQKEWVIGISGAEIPWLGTVKLMVSGGDSPGVSQVPGQSFVFLITFVGAVLVLPMVIDPVVNRILRNSPEAIEAQKEEAMAKIYSSEEE